MRQSYRERLESLRRINDASLETIQHMYRGVSINIFCRKHHITFDDFMADDSWPTMFADDYPEVADIVTERELEHYIANYQRT